MIDSNDILDSGFVPKEMVLVRASANQRLLNYFIDHIVFTLVLFVVLAAFIYGTGFDEWVDDMNGIVDHIFSSIFYVIVYFASESFLEGKTIGKFITKTRVLTQSGDKPTQGQLLKRSFIRLVPFEALSFLNENNSGWHDKWSDTIVISEKDSIF
ncbi:MAG: putative RDD family membrane protein YckC [Saprospiraceae bacterium]|jgi:uncharacterized RDD family membrane protein YckC